MSQHLTSWELKRLLSGAAAPSEVESAVDHLRGCQGCWQHSAAVFGQSMSEVSPTRANDQLSALLCLLGSEQKKALELLRSRSWWADLRDRDPEEQRHRLKAAAELRTHSFFRTVLDEATATGFADPFRGEQLALFARDVAIILPNHNYPARVRRDLEGEALTVVANCRRLAANWNGSLAAIKEARERLKHGSGDPLRQARLFSIHASLACDTGNLEAALDILGRAANLYRNEKEIDGLAGVVIQEAAILLIASRAEEAIARATEVLAVAPLARRLEMIAKSLVTEALIASGRANEALLAYHGNQALYSQFPEFGLRVTYLEAKLLDALGYSQESERLFRHVVDANWQGEQYKEAFRTMYALFESLYKHSSYSKAENLCLDAMSMIDIAGNACHAQIKVVWQLLREHTRERALNESTLSAVRLYLVRNWSVPAAGLPFDQQVDRALLASSDLAVQTPAYEQDVEDIGREEGWIAEVVRPVPPDDLASGAYMDAVDRYDRDLILAALVRCNSEIKPTARFLGISRNSLRFKMRKYGI